MTGLRPGRPGNRGGLSARLRPALWPSQPPTHRIPEVPSAGVEQPGPEDHSLPSCSVQVKAAWNYTNMSVCPGA
jgi:hypothetical protein